MDLLPQKRICLCTDKAQVKDGAYISVDPVFVASVHEADEMRASLQQAIAKGNPIIPQFSRDNPPKLSLLKDVGVKTWGVFEKGAFAWILEIRNSQYWIVGQRKDKSRGWVDDPDQTVVLPMGATIDELCDQIIPIIQAKAGLP